MIIAAKALEGRVIMCAVQIISLIIFIEEIVFEGLINEVYKWFFSFVVMLFAAIVIDFEKFIKVINYLTLLLPGLTLFVLIMALVSALVNIRIRVKMEKGYCIKKDIQILIVSNTFLWIDMYLNCSEFVNLLELSAYL